MCTAGRRQRTIARDVEVHGVGYFHGSDVTARFLPAEADQGIVFVRTDLPSRPEVRSCIAHVLPTPRRTTLCLGEARVEMVEHVMAALAGLRIDNCVIEINAPETPACDGSSLAFVEALSAAGAVDLKRPRATYVIADEITMREGSSILSASPARDGRGDYVLSYHLDYRPHPVIGEQRLAVAIDPESFVKELASARTFVLEDEAHALRKAGIGRRATETDLLIFGPDGVMGNALRFPDECVRHKLLDMLGDLALLEMDLIGQVSAYRSGHALNAALARELTHARQGRGSAA